MCAVTHRANPYQLALLIKKSFDDVIGTQKNQSTIPVLRYCFSLIYALFAESSIDTFKEMYILHNIKVTTGRPAYTIIAEVLYES